MGFVVLTAGGLLTATSNYRQERGAALARYDAVIEAWNARHAAEFNASSWVLNVDGREFALQPGAGGAADEANADAAASDDPLATQPYASERFALPGSLWELAGVAASASSPASSAPLGQQAAGGGGGGETAWVAWARQPHSLSLAVRGEGGAPLPLPLLDAPLLRREVLPDSSWKECLLRHGGTLLAHSDSDCVVWSAVAELCVAVSRDEVGSAWRVDARFGDGGGCEPWGGGEAPAVTYTHVPAPEAKGDEEAALPSWAALLAEAPGRVQVRSAHDPALWAANATGGTMVFAQPAAEQDAIGRVLIIIGGLAMLTGAMLGVPALVAAARRRGAGVLPPLDKRSSMPR